MLYPLMPNLTNSNKNLIVDKDYIYIQRDNFLLKFTHLNELLETTICQNIVKEFNNKFYINGSEINFHNLEEFKFDKVQDFHIYNSKLYFFTYTYNIYYYYEKFLYYYENSSIYRLNLEKQNIEFICKAEHVSYLYVKDNYIICSTLQGKIIIIKEDDNLKNTDSELEMDQSNNKFTSSKRYDIYILHKHDTPIVNTLKIDNILYILTKNNKFSALDLRRDNIKYLCEFISSNIKLVNYEEYLYILNEYEFIKYNIKTNEKNIYYNLPFASKVFNIQISTKNDIVGFLKVDPVFDSKCNSEHNFANTKINNNIIENNDALDQIQNNKDNRYLDNENSKNNLLLTAYKNNIYIFKNNLQILKIYAIKNNGIFVSNNLIFILIRNKIDIYLLSSDLIFLKRINTVKNLFDIFFLEDIIYYIIKSNDGFNILRSDMINICVQKEFIKYKFIDNKIYLLKKENFKSNENFENKHFRYIIDKNVKDFEFYNGKLILIKDKLYVNKLAYDLTYDKVYVFNDKLFLVKTNTIDIYTLDMYKISTYTVKKIIKDLLGENILIFEDDEISNF